MFVKVCGIKEKFEVDIVLKYPISHFGVIVGVKAFSEDEVSLDRAKELITYFRSMKKPFPIPTLVTHLQSFEEIANLVYELEVSFIQLQNDVSLSVIRELKSEFPWLAIIKAIHIFGDFRDILSKLRAYEKTVDYILLDSYDGFRLGGTGLIHDWSIDGVIRCETEKPIIVAGGLSGYNVGEVVSLVRPFGVDANSRLKGKDGFKDELKVRDFVLNYYKALLREDNRC